MACRLWLGVCDGDPTRLGAVTTSQPVGYTSTHQEDESRPVPGSGSKG